MWRQRRLLVEQMGECKEPALFTKTANHAQIDSLYMYGGHLLSDRRMPEEQEAYREGREENHSEHSLLTTKERYFVCTNRFMGLLWLVVESIPPCDYTYLSQHVKSSTNKRLLSCQLAQVPLVGLRYTYLYTRESAIIFSIVASLLLFIAERFPP